MRSCILLLFVLSSKLVFGNYVFIPMDEKQSNHLKAYGIAYWVLKMDQEVDWLLNYRGGSFMTKY
ncbi:MAG: asparagine synthetase B, partial [Cyclobacteriaceae bacterium]